MTRVHYFLICALALLAAGSAVAFFRWRPSPQGDDGVITTSGAVVDARVLPGPTPLPDYVEAPNLVSQRIGRLRLYVAVPNEIALYQAGSNLPLATVPIRVVLENETYKELDATKDFAGGLFVVTVTREDGAAQIFNSEQTSEGLTHWGPAERKSFVLEWPIQDAVAGHYVISVTPGFGERTPVRIRTVFK
jgi:hypothetical protein